MKKEWYTLAGICSVVLGIVLFSVIMGGYTSLIRAQSRINAAKKMMTEECDKQLKLLPDLMSLAGDSAPPDLVRQIEETAGQIPPLLTDINADKAPLDPGLVKAFEGLQTRLSRDTSILVREIQAGNETVKQYEELMLSAAYITKRYNKEVRYFNGRKTVFPGFVVAKLFGLDALHFPEIAPDSFNTGRDSAES